MTLEEIVNKAIPISFPGVNCAALERLMKQKALVRREELKKNILSLLETVNNGATGINQHRVDKREY